MKNAQKGVSAEFTKAPDGGALITFADLEYLRADTIILDRKDLALHAVLHEAAHYIGHISQDLLSAFTGRAHVALAAPHYNGGTIGLKTPLVVNH